MQAATATAPAPATTAVPAPQLAPVLAPPAAPGRAVVTVTNADGTTQTLPIPLTRQEVGELRDRREELSDQLTSAAGRRRRLAEDFANAPEGPSKTGMEGRLVVLDRRLAQLESDIAATGRQLSAAPQGLISSPDIPGDIPDNVAQTIGVFTFFVLFPLTIVFARNLWKRGSRLPPPAQLSADTSQRLERLEHGVEAIAIEIERVAEGQRFVTKLLSEGHTAGKLGARSLHEESTSS